VQSGPAGDQRRAVQRLVLAEVRIVDDAGEYQPLYGTFTSADTMPRISSGS